MKQYRNKNPFFSFFVLTFIFTTFNLEKPPINIGKLHSQTTLVCINFIKARQMIVVYIF